MNTHFIRIGVLRCISPDDFFQKGMFVISFKINRDFIINIKNYANNPEKKIRTLCLFPLDEETFKVHIKRLISIGTPYYKSDSYVVFWLEDKPDMLQVFTLSEHIEISPSAISSFRFCQNGDVEISGTGSIFQGCLATKLILKKTK